MPEDSEQDSDDISSRFFNLAEATAWLDKSEKTLYRLINSKKIQAEKRTTQGKKRWMIKGHELILYRLRKEKDGWFHHTFSPIPPIEGYGEYIACTLSFGAWGVLTERVSPRVFVIHGLDQASELVVSLDDLLRYIQRPRSKKQYEKLKNELRSRLRDAPENFRIRFRLDASTQSTLERIVKSVPIILFSLSEITEEELQQEAIGHVLNRVLPDLWRANREYWTGYVKVAVENFYLNKYRQDKSRLANFNLSIDVDRLAALDSEYSEASRANLRARKQD